MNPTKVLTRSLFKNESGTYKDILSPGNRWLVPNAYLRIFGRKFMKDIGFDADKPKSGTKSKIPKKENETNRNVRR